MDAKTLDLRAMLPAELEQFCKDSGFSAFRGRQIFNWLQRRGVATAAEMKNLPSALRTVVDEHLAPYPEINRSYDAADRTRKLLLRMRDDKDVETVLIPMHRADELARLAESEQEAEELLNEKRTPVTQCVSSQIGCAMGCGFCASGIAGLKRHLSAAEMISQVHVGKRELPRASYLRNLVLMGMGEPLHNYDVVARFLRLITHQDGLALSHRRVTLSTSGLVPEIDKLGRDFEGKVQLAISLHAIRDDIRTQLMPINKRYPLKELVAALKRYPLPKRRRITLEYILIDGLNDSIADAKEMVRVFRGIPAKVNLIPMNPVPESPYLAPSWDHITKFQDCLCQNGLSAFVRHQRGDEVDAACGQLALYGEDGKRAEVTRRGLKVIQNSPG